MNPRTRRLRRIRRKLRKRTRDALVCAVTVLRNGYPRLKAAKDAGDVSPFVMRIQSGIEVTLQTLDTIEAAKRAETVGKKP